MQDLRDLYEGRKKRAIEWFLSLTLILAGVGNLDSSLVAGLVSILGGIYVLPPARRRMLEYIEYRPFKYSPILIALVAFLVAGAMMPDSQIGENTSQDMNETGQISIQQQSERASFEVVNSSIFPASGEEPLIVKGVILVRNTGNSSGFYTVELEREGILEDFKDVKVPAGERREVSVNTTIETEGNFEVSLLSYYAANNGEVTPDLTRTIEVN